MSICLIGYFMGCFVVYKVNSNNIYVIILIVRFILCLYYEYLFIKYIKNILMLLFFKICDR